VVVVVLPPAPPVPVVDVVLPPVPPVPVVVEVVAPPVPVLVALPPVPGEPPLPEVVELEVVPDWPQAAPRLTKDKVRAQTRGERERRMFTTKKAGAERTGQRTLGFE
jgi:hypothetical protein